jgi:hypothetical protein
MRLFTCCVVLSLVLIGCGGAANKAPADNSATITQTRETETITSASPSPTATPSPATKDGERPVEFTYLGITPDKESISYRIKVNSAKPISQVDLSVKYMDASGNVVEETTIAWQNVVKSARKPIEKGKTYDVEGYLPQGATKAECTLKRVIFEDGTRWNAD